MLAMAIRLNSDVSMANGPRTTLAPADPSGHSDDLRLGDLVDGLPPVITPQVSVQAAAQILRDRALSCLVVVDGATVLGLFTEREVLQAVAVGGDVMATPLSLGLVVSVPALRPEDSLLGAAQTMATAELSHLLVVDEQGQLCGLVPRQRLIQALAFAKPNLDPSAEAGARSEEAIADAPTEGGRYPALANGAVPLAPEQGLTILAHIHHQLLGLEGQNRLRVLTHCLERLGLASGALGAALFETHLDREGTTLTSLRTAWWNPSAAKADPAPLQNLPQGQLQRWHGVLSRGGMLTGRLDSFAAVEQPLLHHLGAAAVLVLPLRCHGQYFGFLVFSYPSAGQPWSSATVELLRTASMALSLTWEQYTMQSCLHQTQSAFASLFHHSPDPMAVTTFPEGRHLLVNASYARWLGRPGSEIIGRRPAELGMVHNRRQFARLRRQICDRGRIQNIEIDSHLADGQTHTLLVSAELTQLNDQPCLLSIGKDITERKAIQATLSAAEARFRVIFEQIDVGICQANLDGQLMDVNPGMGSMLGFSRAELIGKTFPEITHPDDLALDLHHYNRLLAGELESFTIEKRYCHKAGGFVWVALTVCLVRSDDGEPLFSIGVSQDISDLKQEEAERQAAEKALQASHQRINNILESITDAFFALDQSWQFTYLNQRAEQFLQRSRHRVLGQNLWYEFPEVLGTQMSKELRRAMVERVSLTFEEYMAHSDSWCEFHVYPTQEGLAVYFRDVTGRKRAYEQIEHQIRREQALNRVVQAIRRSLDLDIIFETAAREIAHLLQADHVDIQMRQPADGGWRVLAEYRADDPCPACSTGCSTTTRRWLSVSDSSISCS